MIKRSFRALTFLVVLITFFVNSPSSATPSNINNEVLVTSGGSSVEASLNKTMAVIMLENLEHTYDGNPKSATITTYPEGVKVKVLYNSEDKTPTKPGVYLVEASIIDPEYEENTVREILVIKDKVSKKNAVDSNSKIVYLYSADKNLLIVKSEDYCSVKMFDKNKFPVMETGGFNLVNIAMDKYNSGIYTIEMTSNGEKITNTLEIKK